MLSGGSAFQHVRFPSFSSLAAASDLAVFSGLSAASVLPAIPTLRPVGFCLTGELSYYRNF
jgi:hypothetical protein